MWTLIDAQLRYRRSGLAVAAAATLAFGLILSLELDVPVRIWALAALFLGGGLNLAHWMNDQRERRLLLWAALPLRPVEMVAARLVTVLLVQAVATAVALVGVMVTAAVRGAPDPRIWAMLLGAQGFALIAIAVVHLHEELTWILSRRRWALIVLNVGLVAFSAALAFSATVIDSWPYVVATYVVAGALAMATVTLFVRRRSFLVGVNCVTGFPVDWSEGTKAK